MNINKATGQNPQIQAQKIASSTQAGKLAGQNGGKELGANRVESKLIQRLNVSSAESTEKSLETVKAKFQSGQLLTREAAEAAASSILD